MDAKPNKPRRNEPCYCGSGKKYKKCHYILESLPRLRTQAEQEFQKKRQARKNTFGNVNPIVHADFDGHKFVSIGNRLFYDKRWKTFTDFLIDYVKHCFGEQWWKTEASKPSTKAHPVMQWILQFPEVQRKTGIKEGDIYSVIPNGPVMAYLTLSYDLYILQNHQSFQNRILKRLRNNDQFQGARYELQTAATFFRAGFQIEYEDEKDGSKRHPEFIATHVLTGQKFAVEAKSRHRKVSAPGPIPAELKLGITHLLTNAVSKNVNIPYVIFIDLNIPPTEGNPFEQPWFAEMRNSFDQCGARTPEGFDKFNLIVFTNHPVEYTPDTSPAFSHIVVLTQKPLFLTARGDALSAILNAVPLTNKIPSRLLKN